MSNFGWDFPPGVTGNEPEIAGWPECPKCGGSDLVDFAEGYKCMECGHVEESGPDPDDERDRRLEGVE